MAITPGSGALAPRLGKERAHRAGGQPRAHRVRPRGQDDRNTRTENDARRIGLGEEGQVLGQHVPGLEIRHHQDLRWPATADRCP